MHQLDDFELEGDSVRSLCTCEWVSTPEPTRWDAGMQWGRHRDEVHSLAAV